MGAVPSSRVTVVVPADLLDEVGPAGVSVAGFRARDHRIVKCFGFLHLLRPFQYASLVMVCSRGARVKSLSG